MYFKHHCLGPRVLGPDTHKPCLAYLRTHTAAIPLAG